MKAPVLFALVAAALALKDLKEFGPRVNLCKLLIGTGGGGYGIGHNNPGPQYPFGAFRLGPDTSLDGVWIEFNHFGGYYWRDTHIRAFSHTHFVGGGVADYGNIGIMPVSVPVSDSLITRYAYRSAFSKSTEVMYPGYYGVFLETPAVQADLTVAGTHAGRHRYTYSQGAIQNILVDVCHTVKAGACRLAEVQVDVENQEITGFVLNGGALTGRSPIGGVYIYFAAKILRGDSQGWTNFGVWENGVVENGRQNGTTTTTSLGAFVSFGSAGASLPSQQIHVEIGISLVSVDLARQNREIEIAQRDFDTMHTDAVNLWEDALGVVEIVGGSQENQEKFYTALYRTMMSPTDYSESDGSYPAINKQVSRLPVNQKAYYSDLSIWDTFRTQNPWLLFILPEVGVDVCRSLVLMYQEGGDLPRWAAANTYTGGMFGDHANSILVDCYKKENGDFNVTAAYEAMKIKAMGPRSGDGRAHIEKYIELGYIPEESSTRGACHSLAYYYDDQMISDLADLLDYEGDRDYFAARAQNYRLLWNAETEFMCVKRESDGGQTCIDPRRLVESNDYYTEGNAWHYSFFVPHDVEGLISLHSSVGRFVERLEQCMNLSTTVGPLQDLNLLPNMYYWAGNEHNLLHPFLFSHAGRADRTFFWSRWLLNNKYSNQPDGLPGNDDYGTMSAWFTFASIGFFPNAGHTYYFLTSPLFDSVTVHLPKGDLQIIAHNNSETNVFVERVTLNGVDLVSFPFIEHSVLAGGGLLEYWMSPTA
eukprot:TRINITY_DN2549_c0_g1_i1.p1 TRINITY_DN2549_c0_g1~~TRINITY_DN2549_c0_g1_i1.p1  ORF type:complete len:761 (+),score=153.82 TRINITY_DN2549_c0_g1_i1:22-2304(+)